MENSIKKTFYRCILLSSKIDIFDIHPLSLSHSLCRIIVHYPIHCAQDPSQTGFSTSISTILSPY